MVKDTPVLAPVDMVEADRSLGLVAGCNLVVVAEAACVVDFVLKKINKKK